MPETIKGLNELVEEVRDDVSDLRDRVGTASERIAGLSARVDGLHTDNVDTKRQLLEQTRALDAFRGETKTVVALLKWGGVTLVTTLVTIGIAVGSQLFTVAQQAGRLEATVTSLQETTKELKSQVEEQNRLLRDIARELGELKARAKQP